MTLQVPKMLSRTDKPIIFRSRLALLHTRRSRNLEAVLGKDRKCILWVCPSELRAEDSGGHAGGH